PQPERLRGPQLRLSRRAATRREAAEPAARCALRGRDPLTQADPRRRVGPDALAGASDRRRTAGADGPRPGRDADRVDGGQTGRRGAPGGLGRRRPLHQSSRARAPRRRRVPRGMTSRRVAVIGAGTMGHGIAYVAALAGCEVRLTDARPDALPQALDKIGALLVSNTSSLSIGQIALALTDPARLVGMHFFNPVHVMKLVEVVTHGRESRPAAERAVEFARALGKEPIVVRDSPGFASSRLGVVLGLEAMRMLEQDVASAEDIDKAMELGYNHPMGPLKLTDLVGLDVRLAIAEYLHATLGKPQYEPPKILREKVKKGEL